MRRHIYNIINTTPSQLFDSVLSLLAPDKCNACGAVSSKLCPDCQELAIASPPSRCYQCHTSTTNYRPCNRCRKTLTFDSLLYAAQYEGVPKTLVMNMKLDSSRQAAKDIAGVLARMIDEHEYLNETQLIIPVPTIQPHIRQRGFDHTLLIAQMLSRTLGLPYSSSLERTSNTRQVGKNRKERFKQMENGVKFKEVNDLNGVNITLIDDIVTTGATLSACSRTLKQAGAKRVDAVVFASGNV